MNKILIVVIGVLVAAGVSVFLVFKLFFATGAPIPTNTNTYNSNTSPNNTTSVTSPGQPVLGNTYSLATASGGTIQTKDFKNDPEAGQYPASGYYYLGIHAPVDGASTANVTAIENPPYTILYIDSTQYFNITILQEPLGEVRQDAEKYLMEHLGVTQIQMCSLKYIISVPNSVNQIYSSKNIGFSFCSGAVQL